MIKPEWFYAWSDEEWTVTERSERAESEVKAINWETQQGLFVPVPLL